MNSLFARSRNRDFLNACRRRIADLTAEGHQPTTIQQIYAVGDHILTKPAPAYYVDYYRACHILSKALTAGQPPKATYQSGQVWVDMYRDLCEAIKLYPTRPTRDLIFALCAGELGHPRFYITPRTAHKIIYSNLYKIFSL